MRQGDKFKRVGILYLPKLPAAKDLAEQLRGKIEESDIYCWTCSAWDEEQAQQKIAGTDLLLSLGGDGTVLRAARIALEDSIPILGIKLGRLGFMTDLSAEEALSKIPKIFNEEGWIDERAVLQAEVCPGETGLGQGAVPLGVQYALNDVVVARGAVARVINIETRIDGDLFTTYKADGVVVATATGSTSYSLAIGGPILHPQSNEIILKPIAPHLTISNALVLPPTARVDLTVHSDYGGILSVDGQVDHPLYGGDVISIKLSQKKTRFLRYQPPGRFYSTVTQRLTRME